MQPSDMFLAFTFWCLAGWFLLFVLRLWEVSINFDFYDAMGYKKAASVGRIVAIILWPIGQAVVLVTGKLLHEYIKKHGPNKDL